ncbi:hypothetical protein AAAT87_09745 [Segatella sinensis]|uniref:Lipoprotein n=1 Tax=Segatella sinensis TaxID=3085167 RepID=A0ABV1FZG5_9BACT
MKRQLTSILLFSALLVGGASTFVSCTDNESDSNYNTSVSLADAIKNQVDELGKINTWLGDLKTSNPDLAAAIDARIKDNWKAIGDKGAVSELAKYASLDKAIRASKAYTGMKDTLDTHTRQIAALEDMRKSDSLIFAKADSALNYRLDTLSAKVNSELAAQQILNSQYDKALDYLVNKNITGAIVDGTKNPVFGYLQSGVLDLNLASAYYGYAAEGDPFWGIDGGKVVGANEEGNAGYIYITLNPKQVAPELVSVELTTTSGKKAEGFKLGDLQECNEDLTWGYTRAASGFYKIPVTCVTPENDGFDVNKGELKEAAKNILSELKNPKATNLNLGQIATTMYHAANNQLKKLRVQITFKLYDATKGEYVDRTVSTEAKMGAFAVKPVGFTFLQDNQALAKLAQFGVEHFRIPTLSDKLAKIADAVKFNVTASGNVVTMLTAIDVTAAENANGGVDFFKKNEVVPFMTLDNAKIVDKDQVDIDNDNHTQYIYKIQTNALDEVMASINKQISDKLQPIQNALNSAKLNNYVEKYDNYVPKVNAWLKKISANIANVNRLLQPALFISGESGEIAIAGTDNHFTAPTVKLGGSYMLCATTYTAEFLAPAYKKALSADNATITVDGKDASKPFAGNVQKALFTPTKEGVCKITYEAVDYSGVPVEKNFYINVVK